MGKWEITSLTENMEVELNSMCPLDSVNLSIFKFTSRQSLKAKFINNKCRYFELGAIEKRKVRLLPYDKNCLIMSMIF